MLNLVGAPAEGPEDFEAAVARELGELRASGLSSPSISHGQPVTFSGCIGQLYPAEGPVAVLMLGAIGYEEMCVRTTWRTLAERIQARGAPCLRFDYPGVGDSLDPATPSEGIDDWFEAVRQAARYLRWATGRDRIVIVGQGVGGALAGLTAQELGHVEATVFMAPVTSGRTYLRELSLWARMLTDRIGITPDPDDAGGHAVAGIALEPGRAAAIKAFDLSKLDAAPAPKALVVGRVNHGGDERLAERLSALGVATESLPYAGYEILATDPTQAQPPYLVIDAVAEWIAGLGADVPTGSFLPRRAAPLVAAPAPTRGDGFRERPLRFGPDDRLFGVLCEPEAPNGQPPVIFANAGRDYHIGWGRATVEQARAFAQLGVPSLRIDAGGIGDSLPNPGRTEEVLYSDGQIEDMRFAIDAMAAMGFERCVLVGRCSGAYAAFNAAVQDPRVDQLIMVNTERFVWDPREDIAEALRYAHRSIGDFGATLWKRGGWKRLLKGQLRVAAAANYVSHRLYRKAAVKLAPLFGDLTPESRLYRDVHRRFAALEKRGVRTWLVYSEGDLGLNELHTYFGEDGRKVAQYPNVWRAMVMDADHNFTHKGARARLLATLAGIVAPPAVAQSVAAE
ncbi:alpha/beta hydrolase [Methylopila sp. M107]|uniref:serine aminopeptidase domain-containing protein n=1 Tax=Methylopila sp. M107 TaxID=1101190 RepID=UPI0003664A73|nr:alpha/beta hydrolase [Methylopila sp. M107]